MKSNGGQVEEYEANAKGATRQETMREVIDELLPKREEKRREGNKKGAKGKRGDVGKSQSANFFSPFLHVS